MTKALIICRALKCGRTRSAKSAATFNSGASNKQVPEDTSDLRTDVETVRPVNAVQDYSKPKDDDAPKIKPACLVPQTTTLPTKTVAVTATKAQDINDDDSVTEPESDIEQLSQCTCTLYP